APTPDQRRAAAARYDRANAWLVARRPDRALPLLLECCRLDPANLIYRRALRVAQRDRGPGRGLRALGRGALARRRVRAAWRPRGAAEGRVGSGAPGGRGPDAGAAVRRRPPRPGEGVRGPGTRGPGGVVFGARAGAGPGPPRAGRRAGPPLREPGRLRPGPGA